MPGIVRLGDNCSGHKCWPSRPTVGSCQTVYVNGRLAVRQTDSYATHC